MHVTIVGLLRVGHWAVTIHTLLRQLKMNECCVYHVRKLFEETGIVRDHLKAGQTCSTCTKNVVNAVCARITRDPYHKQKILSQEMNLQPRTILCVLGEDFNLGANDRYTKVLLAEWLNSWRICFLKRKVLGSNPTRIIKIFSKVNHFSQSCL